MLRLAVSSTQEDDGWSNLALIGVHIAHQASFDSRNYGYAKLSTLFEAVDLFDIERRNNLVYVKDKRKSKNSNKK